MSLLTAASSTLFRQFEYISSYVPDSCSCVGFAVSVSFDDEFVVHDIKVIEGEKGLFIAMPSKKALDGEYRDTAHPINSDTRDRMQKIILDKYAEAMEEESVEE